MALIPSSLSYTYSNKTTGGNVPAVDAEKVTATKKNADTSAINQLIAAHNFVEIASANNIVPTGLRLKVTGTTEMQTVTITNVIQGNELVLLFESSLVIKHEFGSDGSFSLNNGADYTVPAGTILTFVLNDNNRLREIGSSQQPSATDADAIHVNVDSEISGITAKATPTTSDLLVIEDVADGNKKKKVTIGTLPGGGGGSIWEDTGSLTQLITDRTVKPDP